MRIFFSLLNYSVFAVLFRPIFHPSSRVPTRLARVRTHESARKGTKKTAYMQIFMQNYSRNA
jgi:hypothetical protein